MKRILLLLCSGSVLCLTAAPFMFAQDDQPLGDVARMARRHKPAPPPGEKVYDNDNLPGKGAISLIGPSDDAANGSDQSSGAGKDDKDKNGTPSADDHKKTNDLWAGKISEQKQEISRLQRELNVLQRESQIHAAVNYADMGTRLGNNAKYAEEDKQYQQQISDKQKALDEATKKLDDMQEEARKAGVPASQRD